MGQLAVGRFELPAGSKPVQASTRNERRHHRNEKARSDEPDPVRQVVDPLTAKIWVS